MPSFRDVDRYLALDFNTDYWEDEAISLVQNDLKSFQIDDWEMAKTAWRNRDVTWTHRFGQVLGVADPALATSILVDMLSSKDEQLVIIAADSLRGMPEELWNPRITPAIKAHLRSLRETPSRIVDRILADLLSKCETDDQVEAKSSEE